MCNQQNQPQTAQHETAILIPAISSERVSINKDLYEGQQKVISLVFDFTGSTNNPVDAINKLIHQWLMTAPNLVGTYQGQQLEVLLDTVTFLYDLQQYMKVLQWYEYEAEKLEQVAGEGEGHE